MAKGHVTGVVSKDTELWREVVTTLKALIGDNQP